MIGISNVPAHLRVDQVIGPEWVWPNDPRSAQMAREIDRAAAE
jgi:hypothetical protein